MAYLEPSEYEIYGLSADTADSWVSAASAMVDAHCRRGSLLLTTYTERLRVSQPWNVVQLTYGPLVNVVSIKARYSRGLQQREEMLFQCALLFGLPGQWVSLDASSVTVDQVSGELQLPVNLMGLRYGEAEVQYTAGLAVAPEPVKIACAQIVKNAQATPGLNVKSSKMDTLQTQYFSDSLLDTQVRMLLRPFVAERLGC